jgi:hypothetical protein
MNPAVVFHVRLEGVDKPPKLIVSTSPTAEKPPLL